MATVNPYTNLQFPTEFPPRAFPFRFTLGNRKVAIWSYIKSDFQIFEVEYDAYPALQLKPIYTERARPFYFAAAPQHEAHSVALTVHRPRARIHTHSDMGIWFTGGWICRRQGTQIEPVMPIWAVSDPAKLTWAGNVGIYRECEAFRDWVEMQTLVYYRPIIRNRRMFLAPPSAIHQLDSDDDEHAATAAPPTAQPAPQPIPQFVAEALLEKSVRNEETCPITMEPLVAGAVYVTTCFHVFEREAMDEWRTKHNTCPVCKAVCGVTAC